MTLPAPQRAHDCLSDLAFDRLFAGESSADGVAEHLAACERCRVRHAALHDERERFLRRVPNFELPRSRSPWRSPLRMGAGGLLLAAAAVLSWLRVPPEPARERLKGAPHIGFFVTHNGVSTRATPAYRVRPGEQVRFVYSNARDAYLAIYGIDAQGTTSVYFPAGAWAQRVPAGSDVLLESAVELDQVLGHELVYALFCDAAFAVEAQRKALIGSPGSAPTAPAHCELDAVSWVVEAGSGE